jgi:hypothetical protein
VNELPTMRSAEHFQALEFFPVDLLERWPD